MQSYVGDGTTDQWLKANVVSEQDAQPGGPLYFREARRPEAITMWGIICGKTDAGDWIAVHCSSSQNGVTVGRGLQCGISLYPSAVFLSLRRGICADAGGAVFGGRGSGGRSSHEQ